MSGHGRANGRTLTWRRVGQTVLEILIAPVLVALATLVGRRWGARAGGLVSAFPAVVGPVLLIIAQQRGGVAAARAASATLLGLVALSGFALAYARAARGTRWPASLAAGWACAIAAAAIAGWSLARHRPAGRIDCCGALDRSGAERVAAVRRRSRISARRRNVSAATSSSEWR